MKLDDIPKTKNTEQELPDFTTKEGLKVLRHKMILCLYKALDNEPNAQIVKQVREILAEADIEILDREKGESEALKLLRALGDEELANEIMNHSH